MPSLRNTPIQQIPIETLMRRNVLAGVKGRKYPLELLDHAVEVAKEVGPTNAARITGVNIESLKQHIRARRIEAAGGLMSTIAKARYSKWSLEQKRAVIQLALKYVAARGPLANQNKCWMDAGRRLGVNGKTVQYAYRRGLLTL